VAASEYDVVSEATPEQLTMVVNQRILEGWQPLGGVSVTMSDFGHVSYHVERYSQALVREQKPSKSK